MLKVNIVGLTDKQLNVAKAVCLLSYSICKISDDKELCEESYELFKVLSEVR
jgi:hypothetical protein